MERPNIYNYKNVIDYLLALYKAEKIQDADFSVRKWAKKTNLDSGNLLRVLQNKKKLSVSMADKLSEAYELGPDEEKYLFTMVRLSVAELERERDVLEIVLSEQRGHTGAVSFVDDQSVFSHWIHMLILSMSRVSAFPCTFETIRENLRVDVSDDIIESAIDRMLALGLISIDSEGKISKPFNHVTSKNDAYKNSPHPYFIQVSELAREAAQLPSNEREFQCFSLALNHKKLHLFKDMIRNFRAKVCATAEQDETSMVYQMNIQLFPLTKMPEENKVRSNELNAIDSGND